MKSGGLGEGGEGETEGEGRESGKRLEDGGGVWGRERLGKEGSREVPVGVV